MEKIPDLNIKEQLKKDREELEKAGMVPKKDEEKYSPEEREEIKKLAYYVWEHRMSNDPERQKKWAKEYGLDENAFSKETIEKLISDNVGEDKQWTADAEKFMRDWDWTTAEKVFKNKNLKKDEKDPSATDSGDKTSAPSDKVPMEDALKKQSAENQRQIENKAAEDERITDLEKQQQNRNMEAEAEQGDLSQAELNQAITDFEAKQAQIAEMRAKKGGRWASLRKTLGLKENNLDADPEVMALEEESKSLYRDLMSKGIHLYKGDKPQLENFLRQFDEFESFRNVRNQELDKKGEVAGFPENILAGLHTLTKKWSELSWKQKIAISVGGGLLVAGGAMALGAGTFGAATLGLGYRWGFRAFGAAAAGVGRNVMLDRQMMTEMHNEAEARLKERMDNIEKYENNLDQGIDEMLNKSGIGNVRKDFEQRRTANELRSLKFARNTFIISAALGETFRYASEAMGGLSGIKDSAVHFLSGDQVSAESMGGSLQNWAESTHAAGADVSSAAGVYPEAKGGSSLQNWAETTRAAGATEHNPVDSYPEGKYGPAGYGTENEGHGEVVKSVDERYGAGRYGPTGHGTETEGHVNEFDERYGPNKTGTEGEGHVNEFDNKYGPGLYGTEGEDHVPDTKPSFIEEAKTSPAAGALTPDDKYSPGKYGPAGYGTEGEDHGDVVKSVDERYGAGKYGPTGHGTETEDHVNEFDERYGPGKTGTEGEGHVNEFDERYGPNKTGTEGEGHVNEFDNKYGPGLYGTEGEGHIPEPEDMSGVRAPDAEAQIAQPSSKLLGYHEVKPGGGIERSAKAIIKANPEAFGLDPDDPKLNTKAGQEAHKLARGLADKYGMTYKNLNEIASHKVQPGDQIQIFQDPLSGKLNLTYNGAAFDDALSPDNIPDVPRGGAAGAAQEVAPSKPGVPTVEDVKPRTGAAAHEHMKHRAGAAENHPSRGGGKMKFSPEIEEMDRVAQENTAKANQYYKNVQEYKAKVGPEMDKASRLAEIRQAIATKPGMIRILDGASFGEKADVWNKSAVGLYNQVMSHGDYVAHDVISADAVNGLNENNIRLMAMFSKFGKPRPGELFENYYQRIFSSSRNIPILNNYISGDIEKIIGHSIK